MKGILAIAASVFKWGVGILVGFIGVCMFIYLLFFVFGLLVIWHKRRQPEKQAPRLRHSPEEIQRELDLIQRRSRL